MFIENPPSVFDLGGLFATHPSIEKRIAVLQGLGGRLPEEAPSGADQETPPHPVDEMPPGVKSPWE
jgi:hypothetical protein